MCAAWRYTGQKARLVNANADARPRPGGILPAGRVRSGAGQRAGGTEGLPGLLKLIAPFPHPRYREPMMNLRDAAMAAAACFGCIGTWAALPAGYAGKPFGDAFHQSGVPTIPGIVQCALYDLGGEGVA